MWSVSGEYRVMSTLKNSVSDFSVDFSYSTGFNIVVFGAFIYVAFEAHVCYLWHFIL